MIKYLCAKSTREPSSRAQKGIRSNIHVPKVPGTLIPGPKREEDQISIIHVPKVPGSLLPGPKSPILCNITFQTFPVDLEICLLFSSLPLTSANTLNSAQLMDLYVSLRVESDCSLKSWAGLGLNFVTL